MTPLLQVEHLSLKFKTKEQYTYALNDVNFTLQAGETLGIVGESGSGKSVSCAALMGLLPSNITTLAAESKALFEGKDLLGLQEKQLNQIRGRDISMIFQDPMTSLNPYICIGDQVAEPLVLHHGMSWTQARQCAIEELERTGILYAKERAKCYPHEFSGGMRQRVMIAMALITRPKILIADEPTTALDVSVQKQVLDLLQERQKEHGTAIILITHDLSLVAQYATRIQVMYAGSILESATAQELVKNPLHAYTRALIASTPAHTPRGTKLAMIPGMAPTLHQKPCGCTFRERNVIGQADLCLQDSIPALVELHPQHWVRNCPGCLCRVTGKA